MRNLIYLFLMVNLLWFGCEPQQFERVDQGSLPSSDQLSFTVTPTSNPFKFLVTNTSKVSGLPQWDFGNGRTASKNIDTAYFPEAGTFTITMTLYTKAGPVSTTQPITTTQTDWAFFNNADNVALSGGTEALNGKSWVIDSLTPGHLGVGPAGTEGLLWWSAPPLDKKGLGIYDDNINFKIIGFVATYTNHGKSFVKSFRANDPNYSNATGPDDKTVDFTPAPGKWSIDNRTEGKYLVLTSSKPIFPCFDVGATKGEYKILVLEQNRLSLVATGGDGNAWHYELIPQGYVKPALKYDVAVNQTANANEYVFSLSNVQVPAGMTTKDAKWTLGDGTEVLKNSINETVTHTFMRKGSYAVSVTVNTTKEPVTKSQTINVPQNHPDYVPYLLDAMVMYQDFGESNYAPMGFDKAGGDGSITTVANPDPTRYPNRSANVGKYTKKKVQWANAFLQLKPGFRFNLTKQTAFKLLVYGKAGDVVLLKLENTDLGGNAYTTGAESRYTIKKDNTWEIATYDFKGVGNGKVLDITTDPAYNSDYYDVIRIMYKPGDNSGDFTFYFDDLAGPHAEGI